MENIFSKVSALTGTIGSGKSTAAQILKSFGAIIISADELAREVVTPGSTGLKEIVSHFGASILNKDGTLNRNALAKVIFSNDNMRKQLESITHPRIRKLAEERCKSALSRDHGPVVYEIPLLFESGIDSSIFKRTILIKANDEICLERTIKRDGISKEDAAKRIAAQIPTVTKEKLAQVVIDNSGTIGELTTKLKTVYETLL